MEGSDLPDESLGEPSPASSEIDLSLADGSFEGESRGDEAGARGSSSGDGLDDILVGADEPLLGTGKAYLILSHL